MMLKSNGGKLSIGQIANFDGFETEVWFSRDAITNIPLFSLVKKEYNITYNGDAFIVHRTAKGFPDMVFKLHKSGLHVYNPNDPRGVASYLFMETVESSKALFTQRQLNSAEKVHNLQAGLAFPSDRDMIWALRQPNMIKDFPLLVMDMQTAKKIYGKSIAMLKDKTVRSAPPVI